MSHSHSFSWRPRKFRAFVTNEYYANRDEYDSVGQSQPYKFEEYVRQNIDLLKEKYRRDKYRIVGDSDER
jgi:hypothetical protein